MAEAQEPVQPTVDSETPAPLSPDVVLQELSAARSVPPAASDPAPASAIAVPFSNSGNGRDLLDSGTPSQTIVVASITQAPQHSQGVPATDSILEPPQSAPLPDDTDSVATTAASVSAAKPQQFTSGRGVPDDLPADMDEEVANKPPTSLGHAQTGQMHEAASNAPAAAGAVPQVASPFAPPLRTSAYPRAEAFIGCPLDVPSCPVELGAGREKAARWLLEQHRVKSALKLLSGPDGGAPTSAEAQLLRFRCLVSLENYEEAAQMAVLISSSQGDATPFEVRLLAAHLPFLLNATDAVPALGMLQELARQLCSSSSRSPPSGAAASSVCERLQALRSLSHVALVAGHGAVAVTELCVAIEAAEKAAAGAPDQRSAQSCSRELLRLYSLLGRHYVSAGSTAAATEAFEKARSCGCGEDEEVTHLLHQGLLAVASGSYAAAKGHFAAAAAGTQAAVSRIAGDSTQSLSVKLVDEAISAENNLAVCRLYTKELRQGVRGLENFVRRNPTLFLRSSVAQNLSALYEFLPDAVHRRTVLKEVATAYHLEDLGPKLFEPS